jgi:hypothetical protein
MNVCHVVCNKHETMPFCLFTPWHYHIMIIFIFFSSLEFLSSYEYIHGLFCCVAVWRLHNLHVDNIATLERSVVDPYCSSSPTNNLIMFVAMYVSELLT